MHSDTTAGPAPRGGSFPATRLSVVRALGSRDEAVRRPAFAELVDGYWRPSYKYVRVRWRLPSEDAEDLTQEFFTRAFEKRYLEGYDPARARFRTYLRTCLDRFAANRRRADRRLKRGGGAAELSVDFAGAEAEIRLAGSGAGAFAGAAPEADPEAWFHREWRRSLFRAAVAELRELCRGSGKEVRFTVFERYDLRGGDGLTYARLGEELGIPATQVTNHLAWARRELRRIVLERLARVCASEEEMAAEARDLLGGGWG